MRWLIRRCRLLLRRDVFEGSMEAEFQAHLDQDIALRVAHGETPEAARRNALRDFGPVEGLKEAARDARGGRGLDDALRDVRYALRILRRHPAYSLTAIATFALGVGAATAIYSVVYGVLFRPLPYQEPERLVAVWERNISRNLDQNVVSLETFELWRDQVRGFSGVAALVPSQMTVTLGSVPERLPGAEVTAGYFSLLGVPMALGRDFVPGDTTAVIVSHGFWRNYLAADPAVVGRAIVMSGQARTVVGVMPAVFDPPRFGWLGRQEFWLPMVASPQQHAWGRYLLVVGRLAPSVTLEQARAEVVSLSVSRQHQPGYAEWSATLRPLIDEVSGRARPTLLALQAGVGLLLIMALTNVAALTLSSMRRRSGELAVRRVLGASDQRLFRQLLVQSLVLSVFGSAAGLLVAWPASAWLVSMLPPDLPRLTSITLDGPVLAGAALVITAATILFGVLAARQGHRGLPPLLAGATAGTRLTPRSGNAILVSAEIAIGVAVSVMALLMINTYVNLRQVDLGFRPEGLLVMQLTVPPARSANPDSQRAFFDDVLTRFEAVPGVQAASLMSIRPFGWSGPADTVRDAAQPGPDGPSVVADIRQVDADTFEVLGAQFQQGTTFVRAMDRSVDRVVVNEQLASALWPNQRALGQRLARSGGLAFEVVGVVKDIHLADARTVPRPAAFLFAGRFSDSRRDILVRTTDAPEAIMPALRQALADVDPTVAPYLVSNLETAVDQSMASERFTTILLMAFAGLALVLTAIGIFGVISSEVSRRQREVGLRLVLGSSRSAILTLLLRLVLMRTTAGVVAGLALAVMAGQSLQSLLFGVEPVEPGILGLVSLSMVMVALAATVVPIVQTLRRPFLTLREG